jgi:hypothetical protein
MNSVSTETLHSRLRNRIIEHLELVSSSEAQLAYQRSVPIAQVSNELFNGWGDWVANESAIDEFIAPIFSPEEQFAVREFNAALDAVAGRTPQKLPYITDFIGTPGWQELASAASKALTVFQVRGMSPEPEVQSNSSFEADGFAAAQLKR